MQTTFYLGIDVSKPYFDVSLLPLLNHEKQSIETERFENSTEGLKGFSRWLKVNKVIYEKTLLVLENTGVYHRLIWSFCSKKNIPIYIGNAAHIKWSFGIARGKNDKIDSIRLCQYAFKHSDEIKLTPVLSPVLLQLKDLMTARSKILSQLNSIKTYLKELRNINEPAVQKVLEQAHQTALVGMTASLKSLETNIATIISANENIKLNYDLILTVPGIGHLTALYMICCTNNFINKPSGKKLACYAGVVPFEHSSGISVKGRTRVHQMANKDLKKLLHLCALTAIQYYQEFRNYYERKKLEGKHSMSILNAIRNKIVLRAASVVNNQKAYVNKIEQIA